MLTQLITETILGAMTGYITNDTAIRTLFKPNGIIEQTRDDFAYEAGRLLEAQVLTPSVLQHQLMLPEVQQELADALRTFLQRELPKVFGDRTMHDLPEHERIIQYLQSVLVRFVTTERDTVLHLLKKHFPVRELLTEEQCEQGFKQLKQVLIALLQEEQFAERIWHSWMSEYGSHTLEDLELAPLCDTVIHNLANQSVHWIDTLQRQYGEQLREAAVQSVRQLQLQDVLAELDKQMENYTLGQYLQCDADALANAPSQLLHAELGKQLLEQIVAEVLAALEKVDTPIRQLIPADLMDDVAPILQQQLPAILSQVLDWVWENQQSVQRMLEEAVDEIAVETGGMKGMLLQQLKDSLPQELVQSSDTYRMILEVFSDEQNTDQTVDWMMYKLTDTLTNNTVGQLIGQLNQNGKLQIMVQQFLYENMERYLTQSGSAQLEQLLNWKSGSLHLANHKDEVETLIVQLLFHGLDQLQLPELIIHGGETITKLPIHQLLQAEDTTIYQLAETLVRKGCAYGAEAVPRIHSGTIYGALYDAALHWLDSYSAAWAEEQSQRIALSDLVQLANGVVEEHKDILIAALSDVGLQLTQGRLSTLAESQIQSLSSEEMLELVQDFMGRELQPLNYLGAGMGALAGATVGMALSTAVPTVSMAAPILTAGVLGGKAAVFGAVGYVTNCAAVKGLFWPYEPVMGMRTIQGVIPKQKERFAGSMGRLVDRYVINDIILQEQIALLDDWVRRNQIGGVLASNERLVQRLFAEVAMEREKLTKPLCQRLTDYGMHQSKDALYQLGSKPLSFANDMVAVEDTEKLQAVYDKVLPMVLAWVTEQLRKDMPLDSLITAEALWRWFETKIEQIPFPNFVAMAEQLLHSEKTLVQLVGDDYNAVSEQMEFKLTQLFARQSTQAKIANTAEHILDSDSLFRWLSHNSSKWVQDNLTMLFHWVESLILELLHNRQEELTDAIERELLQRMGFMVQMGYSMMNGRQTVEDVVARLLHQKLPIFLSVKRKELETILYHIWEETLSPSVLQLAETYIKDNTTPLTHTALRTLLTKQEVQHCAVNICDHVLQTAAQQPMSTWGKYINVEAILARPQMQLGFQWQMHRSEILSYWQMPLQPFIAEQLHNITLARLSRGYNDVVPLQRLIDVPQVNETVCLLTKRMGDEVSVTTLQQWMDWNAAAAVLHEDVTELLASPQFQEWMAYEANLLVLELTEHPDALLPVQCRQVLIERSMQAAFATAKQHGTALLGKMQLSDLAEAELKRMDSAHLELVVRGFAQHYLTHIQNMGWMGAVFAIPGMLLYLFG